MIARTRPLDRETRIHRLSLRFLQPDLESEFQAKYVQRFLPQIRVALLLAVVLYATFGALDPFVLPETYRTAWLLRFGIGLPLLVVGCALSFSRNAARWMPPTMVFLGSMVGVSILTMMWMDGAPSSHAYYAGLTLVCIFLYSFIRLPFVPATVTCWSLTALYEVEAWWTGAPASTVLANTIFLLSTNVIGMSACYSMEWSSRVDFLRRRVISRQATGLRRALAELETRNAELDSFVYSASHDLKAPLVTIAAMAAMLREDHGGRLDDDGRHLLHRVEANARHMERLILDLLTLARIGREPAAPEPVDVEPVVSRLVDELRTSARPDVRVTVNPLPLVWARPVHVEQVFANLLGNAFKYLGDGPDPAVEIGAVDRGELAEFYVRDSGIGIEPAYHAKVFEMFERLREANTAGTGVGLAIVKRIVQANGGRIWVESQKGAGATFRFTWPVP
jgi:signal transduction histidine kinase